MQQMQAELLRLGQQVESIHKLLAASLLGDRIAPKKEYQRRRSDRTKSDSSESQESEAAEEEEAEEEEG